MGQKSYGCRNMSSKVNFFYEKWNGFNTKAKNRQSFAGFMKCLNYKGNAVYLFRIHHQTTL